ncbi:Uncharacterized protein Fot_55157 [Forsythia ovata]|uniref:Uncharacterized protein n=1 Tax=Forsythia ovata TaxID=205694 RepID=A0ABD1P5I6_9LAMI
MARKGKTSPSPLRTSEASNPNDMLNLALVLTLGINAIPLYTINIVPFFLLQFHPYPTLGIDRETGDVGCDLLRVGVVPVKVVPAGILAGYVLGVLGDGTDGHDL